MILLHRCYSWVATAIADEYMTCTLPLCQSSNTPRRRKGYRQHCMCRCHYSIPCHQSRSSVAANLRSSGRPLWNGILSFDYVQDPLPRSFNRLFNAQAFQPEELYPASPFFSTFVLSLIIVTVAICSHSFGLNLSDHMIPCTGGLLVPQGRMYPHAVCISFCAV